MKKTALSTIMIILVAGMTLTTASANRHNSGKMASDLRNRMEISQETMRVIITYTDEADMDAMRPSASRQFKNLGSIRAVSGRFTQEEIQDLANDPNVASISPDRRVRATMDVAVAAVAADRVQQHLGLTGQGITIAMIDSGVTPNTAVPQSRILASLDFTGNGRDEMTSSTNNSGPVAMALNSGLSQRPTDGFGHGTHIASTIGGSGFDGSVLGIAPGVNFVSLKVLDGEGAGYASNVIQAIDWAIEHRAEYGIRVLNLALGHPVQEAYQTDPITRATERAWAAGLLVVASAGNRGRDGNLTINSPGNDPYVLTVGAMNDLNTETRSDDISATYSSQGPTPDLINHQFIIKPDVTAPGNRIISTLGTGATLGDIYPESVVDGDRIELSGTSMATGMVSASAAILLEVNPHLTPDQLKDKLLYLHTGLII